MKSVLKKIILTMWTCVFVVTGIVGYQHTEVHAEVSAADSLSDQIKNAENGATIKLDRDYVEQVDIEAGDNVILDLNGHRISSDTNTVINNRGTITIIDSAGGGMIEIEKGAVYEDVTGIMNETSAVLTLDGISIHTRLTDGRKVAIGIHNKGSINKISNCDIKAETMGEAYAYGIWNKGTITDISDGWYYGAGLVDYQNSNNSLAVNNESGGTVNISGGIFIGTVRSAGFGYGIRSAGTTNISGGSFYADSGLCYKIINNNTDFEKAVATKDNGTINYLNGTSLSHNSDGARVVLGENQHYITFVDESELPIATYVMDNAGNIVQRMGHIQDSYNVYFKNKTEVVTESDLSRYGSDTILYVNTGDQREVIYFLGSSVTQGTQSYHNSFADYLGDAYGDQVIIRKRALSGTPIADRDNWSYVKRMEKDINPNAKVDHLVVQLSTNDAGWVNSPIGTLTGENVFDKSAMKKDEVIGAIEYITAYAQETWGCRVTFWPGPEYNSDKYKEMREHLVNEVYSKWSDRGMGVLDFWTLWTPESGDINPDGVHPYKQGYLKMVPYTYDYLKEFDAKVVSDAIAQIGDVTEEGCSGERIARARFLYDNMLNDAKSNVSNYQTLLDAEEKYAVYFDGTRRIDNATEVNVLSGPSGGKNENYTALFDGKIATKSGTANHTTTPYIWKMSKPVAIKYYKLTTASDSFQWKGRNPKNWKLYGSNDYDENGNGTWTEIASVSDDSYLEDENYYEALYKVNSSQKYSYYKWELPSENAEFLQMAEFTMYEKLDAKYTVTYDSAGGSAIATQTVIAGENATQPSAPTREGYVFKGWYLGDVAYNFTEAVTENIVLTAKWEAVKQNDTNPDGSSTNDANQNGSSTNDTNPDGSSTGDEFKVGVTFETDKLVYKITKSTADGVEVQVLKPVKTTNTSVTIPSTVSYNGKECKVISIEKNAFKKNKNITKVTIGKNVETIGANAFYNCTKLKTVKFGSNVTTIGDKAFYKCTELTKVSLPSKVKTIGKQAFYGCKKVTSVTIGKNVSKIGTQAFYGCSKIKTLTIKSTKLTTKKIGSKAFGKTPKSMTVKVPKNKFKDYKSMLIKRGVDEKAQFKKN